MKRVGSIGVGVCVIIVAALAGPSIGGVIESTDKYGTCENPTDVDQKKCAGQSGDCYPVALNTCASYATNCPGGGVATKSGKPIQNKQWGNCTDPGGSSDKCKKCAYFYCAQAKLWKDLDCPGDVAAACTVAVGKANVCDPN